MLFLARWIEYPGVSDAIGCCHSDAKLRHDEVSRFHLPCLFIYLILNFGEQCKTFGHIYDTLLQTRIIQPA